jgi:hypothetical protein
MLQKFALVFGIIYLVVGLLGFVPGVVQPPPADAPHLVVEANHGRLLGLFPINLLHNLVHLLVGAWGLAGARSFGGALGFARGLAIFYGLLVVLGLIPGTDTLFGLVPIQGHDVWLHALSAIVAAYFGFGPPARAAEERA